MRRIHISETPGLHRHLAVEEVWLERLPRGEMWLLLWQSPSAVVVGRNQNPWQECDVPLLGTEGVALGRRVSGGGTVYQDAGNLNYSFFCHQSDYDRQAVARVILDGMGALGVEGNVGPRDILQVSDKKVSGTAFYLKKNCILHHGTLLVDADLALLEQVLKPTAEGFESRGIASVPSPVCNLSTHRPGLTVAECADAVATAFGADRTLDWPEASLLAPFEQKYASEEWLFSRPVKFTWRGVVEGAAVVVEVERGIVARAEGLGDASGKPFSQLMERVLQREFVKSEIRTQMSQTGR